MNYLILIAVLIFILYKKFPNLFNQIFNKVSPMRTLVFSLVNKNNNNPIVILSYDVKSLQQSGGTHLEKEGLKLTLSPKTLDSWDLIISYQELVSLTIPFTITELLQQKKEISLTPELLIRIEIVAVNPPSTK